MTFLVAKKLRKGKLREMAMFSDELGAMNDEFRRGGRRAPLYDSADLPRMILTDRRVFRIVMS